MKRKQQSDIGGPITKKAKVNQQYSYENILRPLIEFGKLSLDDKDVNATDIIQHPGFKSFLKYDNNEANDTQRQLAHFMYNNLAEFPSSANEKKVNNFNKLNIINKRKDKRSDAYSPSTRSIDLNINKNNLDDYTSVNPLIPLIHEGTHALDDLYMKIPQREAMDILTTMENPKEGKQQNLLYKEGHNRDWYNQAQYILDSPDFTNWYPLELDPDSNSESDEEEQYPEGYGDTTLDTGLRQLKTFTGRKDISNFTDARTALYEEDPDNEQNFFFKPFSEFTAYSVENLHRPWNIHNNQNDKKTGNYWKYFNDGRRFLKGITKGVYRNFRELDPEFSTRYPDANQAFLDRISQLRNYEKYPTAQEYQTARSKTWQPGYRPSYAYNPPNNVVPRASDLNVPVGTEPYSGSSSDYSRTPSPPNYNPLIGGIFSLSNPYGGNSPSSSPHNSENSESEEEYTTY